MTVTVAHPVARTAFYCCSVRAEDAASPHPVCGDTLAARFLDDESRRGVEPLVRLRAPAASNVARHRIIDDLLRAGLAQDPARRVIMPGAGFDTRAFRLQGGRWWELDDPELLGYKEARLPAGTAPNPLTRIPVSFQTDTLATVLAPLAGDDPAMVVMEGVTMYLDDATLADAAAAVRQALPRATLICDLMTPAFARGARYGERHEQPRRIVERAGYAVRERHSIPGRAREAGSLRMPGWLFHTLLRGLRDGYAVYVFDPVSR